jgi:transposase InsO family protein
MKSHRDEYPVTVMAAVLEVSTSGFYAWLQRAPSNRERCRQELAAAVVESFEHSHRNYGSRKIARDLAGGVISACRNTIAKLMQHLGLRSRAQRRRFVTTTDSSHELPLAENQLNRAFVASRPNEKWVADITYLPTRGGWVYLAAVMDLFSRRIVGWAVSDRIDTALVESALENALASRCPSDGLLHHSDRGCQYASDRYRQLLERHGIECSMSRRGNCWDNAPMERFFGALKGEWINHEQLQTMEAAHSAVFRYIEIFYNRKRLHQSLGYVSPVDYEAAHRRTEAA